MKGEFVIMVAIAMFFMVYNNRFVYAQYPGYDQRFRPLLGGIQIEITKAEWYGPSYSKGFCSLAFPVNFVEGGTGRLGFITAGHCIETANGGDYVDQPKKLSWWDYSNFIGRGIRSSYPHGGGSTDLDAALIRLENVGFEAFIYENGNLYFPGDNPDANNKVGIIGYRTPTTAIIDLIVYKSGRTTGLTYGRIVQIDYRTAEVYPLIKIVKLDRYGKPYYDSPISNPGDSGGAWYIHIPIYSYRIDGFRVYHYGAEVIGIHFGKDPNDRDYPNSALASYATKVSEKWPELHISYPICGPRDSPSCR